jgi:hypothetical protein
MGAQYRRPAVAFFAVIAAFRPALAQPNQAPEPLRVRLEVPSDCIDADGFYREVRERTQRARLASPGERAATFVVRIRRTRDALEGSLALEHEGPATKPKIIQADTCEDVVSALALIAALSVDPEANAFPPPSAGSTASPGSTVSPVALPPDPDLERVVNRGPTPEPAPPRSVTAERMPTSSLPPDERPSLRHAPTEARPADWAFVAGVSALGLTPGGNNDVAFGPSGFTGFTRRHRGVFAPDLRFVVSRVEGPTVTTALGSGKMIFLTADTDFCPLGTPGYVLAACADLEAGALDVQASGPKTRSATGGWIAPGLGARLSWPPIPLGSRLDLFSEFELGVRVPLVQDVFHFLDDPNHFRVYATPSVVGHGAIDLGLRFW